MIKAKKLPPLERLLELFEYEPFSGLLIRKSTGEEAGSFTSDLHRSVYIDKERYYVHRIVWKMFYRKEPGVHMLIDHINGCPHDNSIENLRRVKTKRNLRNNSKRRLQAGPLTPV